MFHVRSISRTDPEDTAVKKQLTYLLTLLVSFSRRTLLLLVTHKSHGVHERRPSVLSQKKVNEKINYKRSSVRNEKKKKSKKGTGMATKQELIRSTHEIRYV